MVQAHQEPDGHPERRRQHHVAVVQEQEHLKERRAHPFPLAVLQVSAEVAHEALVKAKVGVLRLDPDLENKVFAARRVGPEFMPVERWVFISVQQYMIFLIWSVEALLPDSRLNRHGPVVLGDGILLAVLDDAQDALLDAKRLLLRQMNVSARDPNQ